MADWQIAQEKADELRERVKGAALADLEALADSVTESELREVTDFLEGQIQYQARIWAYLQARHRGSDHVVAVEVQNKAVVHVRRMIGYTQIRNDVRF